MRGFGVFAERGVDVLAWIDDGECRHSRNPVGVGSQLGEYEPEDVARSACLVILWAGILSSAQPGLAAFSGRFRIGRCSGSLVLNGRCPGGRGSLALQSLGSVGGSMLPSWGGDAPRELRLVPVGIILIVIIMLVLLPGRLHFGVHISLSANKNWCDLYFVLSVKDIGF